MASKLEYLQRYMSAAPDAGEKKLRKKKKKGTATSAQSRFHVVDADHEWEQDAPTKDAIEQKWEMDAADEERPVVVADGEIVDASDLPVYVNAEEYLDELHAKKHAAVGKEDLSPPRKTKQRSPSPDAAGIRKRGNAPRRKYSSDDSPPRKARGEDKEGRGERRGRGEGDADASPPRRRNAPAASSRRRVDSDNEDADGDASPPRRQRPPPVAAAARQGHCRGGDEDESGDDVSPPRHRLQQQERKKEAESRSPVRRRPAARDGDSDASPVRRATADRKPRREETNEDEDASPPRKRRAARDSSGGESPPRRTKSAVDNKAKTSAKEEEEPSSRGRPRRTDSLGRDIPETKRDESRSPSRGRRHRGRSRSPSVRRRDGQRSRFGRRRSRSTSKSPRSRRRHSPSRSRGRGREGGRRRDSRSRSPQRGRRGGRELSYREDARSSRRSRSRSRTVSERRGRGRESRRSRSPGRSGPRASSARQEHKETQSHDKEGRSPRKNKDSPSPVGKHSEKKDARSEGESKEETQPARAGLFTATEFAVEHQRKLRQNDFLRTADAKDMGANAETVYRDKRGRKLDMLNEMVRQQEILDGKRERQAREEYEWGTGKVQKEELKSQRELMEQMKSAPFARREDDPELEKLRKERVRAFDPINSKVFQEDDIVGTRSSKKKKSSKESKKNAGAAKPKYAGPPAPPNRFGIQPGYRWDGVVRGTGWEEKLLLRQNKQSAVSEEAYRYAVADM